MADPILEFDPTAEATGTSLVITTGNYGLLSLSSPAPPAKFQWASSIDTEGSLRAAAGHENRTITIGLDVTGATALADLTSKLGKVHREGGTLKYTSPAGTAVVADVPAADAFEATYDHQHYLGGVTSVQFTLPARPYLRGAEQDLGDNVETTLPWLIFTDTSIPGDVPALGRLLIDNDAGSTRQFFVWGLQSRYYDSASTAALFYQAESCALGTGTSAVAGPAGASGAGSNVARNTTLATTSTSSGIIYLGASSTAQTHVGTFRVFARVQPPNTNTGVVSLRVGWQPYTSYSATASLTPTTVTLSSDGTTTGDPSSFEAAWSIVDLGLITLPKPLKGNPAWIGMLHAWSTVSNDDIDIDWIALVPTEEGYGIANNEGLVTAEQIELRHDGIVKSLSSAWRPLASYEGDYLLVPPSGAESRTARVILRLGANPRVAANTPVALDSDIPDMSARLFVTPRYLTLPA